MQPLYIYDPTASDSLSRARGVGRYLQILRENLQSEAEFVASTVYIPKDSVFVNPFFNPLDTPLLMRRAARTQIAVIHDVIPLVYPARFPTGLRAKLNIFLHQITMGMYDRIVTDSQKSKTDIVDVLGIPEDKIVVIYPTVQNSFTDTTFDTKSDEAKLPAQVPSNYCLYVGDVTWNKNIVTLARAVKHAGIPCVFAGKAFTRKATLNYWDKEFADFQELTAGDPLFIFPGYVSDQQLVSLYRNAVCNILVSRDEGFGFSYLEASNLSCPSVLSDIPVFREIAADTALFADPSSPEDIALQIKKLAGNKTVRASVIKNAKERSKKFTKESFKEDFLKACLG